MTDPFDVAKFGQYKAVVESLDVVYDVPEQSKWVLNFLERYYIDPDPDDPCDGALERMMDAAWEWDEEKFIEARRDVLREAKPLLDRVWEADTQELCRLPPQHPLNAQDEEVQSDSAASEFS